MARRVGCRDVARPCAVLAVLGFARISGMSTLWFGKGTGRAALTDFSLRLHSRALWSASEAEPASRVPAEISISPALVTWPRPGLALINFQIVEYVSRSRESNRFKHRRDAHAARGTNGNEP